MSQSNNDHFIGIEDLKSDSGMSAEDWSKYFGEFVSLTVITWNHICNDHCTNYTEPESDVAETLEFLRQIMDS